MVTFFAEEKQILYSSLAARVCRNFKPTDLPLKLSERETATKKATAGQWFALASKIFSTVKSTLCTGSVQREILDNWAASAARWTGRRPRSPKLRNALQNLLHWKAEIAVGPAAVSN